MLRCRPPVHGCERSKSASVRDTSAPKRNLIELASGPTDRNFVEFGVASVHLTDLPLSICVVLLRSLLCDVDDDGEMVGKYPGFVRCDCFGTRGAIG